MRTGNCTQSLVAPIALSASVAFAVACSDQNPSAPGTAPTQVESQSSSLAPAPQGVFQRFVSIGTSISMGWQSDGAVASGQQESWTVQLAALAGRNQTQPLLGGFGCRSPLVAPLSSGARTSGEAAGAAAASFACAPNEADVTLPAQSVAIAAASTYDVMYTTPETAIGDPFYGKLYPRVLPPNTTQLHAALAQKPKFISVELGGNEVLNARSGIAIPGVTLFPVAQWKLLYSALMDTVATQVDRGIVIGLINDVSSFPSFRRGGEIWADRATLAAAFNVDVQVDCDGSSNLLFVPVRIPTAIAAGLTARARGLPAVPFSCAGGTPTTQDFVLTPTEAAIVNGQLATMNAHIMTTAQQKGFAYAALESLYGRADLKPRFSSVQLMTSPQPYGQYVSLDGIHPNVNGHAVLAAAAAQAINSRYGMGLSTGANLIAQH